MTIKKKRNIKITRDNSSGGIKTRRKTKRKTSNKRSDDKAYNQECKINNGQLIKLEPIIGIADVESMYKQLEKFLDEKKDVIIDASDVESVDTALLQLILVFIRKMHNLGASVSWFEPSEVFCKTATLLDIATHLGVEEVEEGK